MCGFDGNHDDRGGDNSDTIPKMSKQEHVFYFLRGVLGGDDWKAFLEILCHNRIYM